MPTIRRSTYQASLPGLSPTEAAIERIAAAPVEERGAVFTKREVVDFILDLIGYTSDEPLAQRCLLEPSFGNGDFLIPALERLFQSCRRKKRPTHFVETLKTAIKGVELHRNTFDKTRARVFDFLRQQDLTREQASVLLGAWLYQSDFLLTELPDQFTHVVGNPPYIRQELIPDELMAEYRRRYMTIYDRADIYVPFIERSLSLLVPGGVLGFICANRWMKNRYGGPLRKLIAERYHLRAYVDMVDTPAFHSDVIAYPAIFIIGNERGSITRLAHQPSIQRETLTRLAVSLRSKSASATAGVKEIENVAHGNEPWIVDAPNQLAVIRRLEKDFPTIEEAGCKVGIGVATGADKVFIGLYDSLDVEEDRKLPLIMAPDITTGEIKWRGYGVINPFDSAGRLVPLKLYPKLATYLDTHGAEIKKRHVSRKNPTNWYRTIDRIYPELVNKPKLLIPDIKHTANIVFEPGEFYPHHNLYFVTSDKWDLRALQAVLLSSLGRMFIATYTTKMHGGYLCFQAQYIRRLRIPVWSEVPREIRAALKDAAVQRDIDLCDKAVSQLYRLSRIEKQAVSKSGAN